MFCVIVYLFFILSSVCSVLCLCQRTLCCILTYALCLRQTYMCVLYTYIVYMCVPSICVPFICCVSMYCVSMYMLCIDVYIFYPSISLVCALLRAKERSPAFWWMASLCLSPFHKRIRVFSISMLSLNMCPLYVFPSYVVYLLYVLYNIYTCVVYMYVLYFVPGHALPHFGERLSRFVFSL